MPTDVTPAERLFSYGTLQLERVQLATFGRRLSSRPDALGGYRLVPLEIDDPGVVAVSGQAQQTMAVPTGEDNDVVTGTVVELTPDEIRMADEYEVAAVQRVAVVLASGTRAWAYVKARRPAATSERPDEDRG